ncbi:MAG TPA: hypothetical protein VNN80_35845, partial [Polyangiaceae bacterium]|nr:hypothetical protein [Polyangiaceae bacterium]
MSYTRKTVSLALTVLLAAVAAGFFAGTRDEWPKAAGYVGHSTAPAVGVQARSYAELREQALSPNAEIY